MRKGHKRADFVPAEPVRAAVKQWLKMNGAGEQMSWSEHQPGVGRRKSYAGVYHILGERMGLAPDSVYKAMTKEYESMQFDAADRWLCAIEQPGLWWQHPVLSEIYEGAVRGADEVYPIVDPIEPEPLIISCEHCGTEFAVTKTWGTPRKFCSQNCRQAAYKARRVAA